MVDNRVREIVAQLDYERVCDYLEFRERIAHERLANYFEEKKAKELKDNDKQVVVDPRTSQNIEADGLKIYSRPTSETYRLIKDCGGEASNYGKAYEEKRPKIPLTQGMDQRHLDTFMEKDNTMMMNV